MILGNKSDSGYARCWKMLRDEFCNPLAQGGVVIPLGYTEEWERCRADTAYWIDTFCKTYDPRTPGKGLPFRLWPKQVEFIHWLSRLKAEAGANFAENGSGVQVQGLCEKSRDVGVSFLCAADVLHDFLFVPGFKAGFGSRKLEYVDDLGNTDSIMEKIRFMMRKLPGWMLPAGWKFGRHDMHCRIINPANGSVITGEGGDGIGRGGRTSVYVVDEAAFIERPHLVDAALSATSALRLDISTPNGPGTPFSVKKHSLPPDKVFSFHWSSDPRKDSSWAEATKKRIGPVVFAAEYDLDESASIEGITIPGAWVRTAVNFKLPMRRVGSNGDTREVGWETVKPVGGFDVGEEGDDLSVFIARHGPLVRVPVSWGKFNTTQSAWRARDEGAKAGIVSLWYDPIGVGAGIKGTLVEAMKEELEEQGARPSVVKMARVPFSLHPVNVGSAPTDTLWPDGKTSKEKFANLKAELWWSLRARFEKVYEFVTQGIDHPAEDLISIPDHTQLISELSAPLHNKGENGKVAIESKKDLKKRGIKSPDFAEALVLSEASYAVKLKQFWAR